MEALFIIVTAVFTVAKLLTIIPIWVNEMKK